MFYALAYAGFLASTVIAAAATSVSVTMILWIVVGLAVVTWAAILPASGRHLPQSEPQPQKINVALYTERPPRPRLCNSQFRPTQFPVPGTYLYIRLICNLPV
jgi:hypothetical protein